MHQGPSFWRLQAWEGGGSSGLDVKEKNELAHVHSPQLLHKVPPHTQRKAKKCTKIFLGARVWFGIKEQETLQEPMQGNVYHCVGSLRPKELHILGFQQQLMK